MRRPEGEAECPISSKPFRLPPLATDWSASRARPEFLCERECFFGRKGAKKKILRRKSHATL
jgi:hypothetical protein